MSSKQVAIYVRVSSRSQDTRSQTPDLERWEKAGSVRPLVSGQVHRQDDGPARLAKIGEGR